MQDVARLYIIYYEITNKTELKLFFFNFERILELSQFQLESFSQIPYRYLLPITLYLYYYHYFPYSIVILNTDFSLRLKFLVNVSNSSINYL